MSRRPSKNERKAILRGDANREGGAARAREMSPKNKVTAGGGGGGGGG